MIGVFVQALVGDGQEREATYEAAIPGYDYHGVTIAYRPVLADKALKVPPRNSPVYHAAATKLVAEHVVGWNVPDWQDKEKVAPITIESAARLQAPVLIWIIDTILGYGLSIVKDKGATQEVLDAKN